MSRHLPAAFAALFLASGCAPRAVPVRADVLAAANASSPETPYVPPANALAGPRPRTLDLQIADPARMRPAAGSPHDHSVHTTPSPNPSEPTGTYVCPMHPDVRDAKPGTCPKCGMALEPVKSATPTPAPNPTPAPAAKPSPTPGGHEHHNHGGAS